MKTFLETVADFVDESHSPSDKHLLVFPSARSLSVFESDFISRQNQAAWLPQSLSYTDFILQLSEYKSLKSTDLLLEFVAVLDNHFKDRELLQNINTWGSLLLKDFDEIINQGVDREEFFEQFKNLKVLERWNPEQRPDSIANKYIGFWEKTKEMFDVFEAHCHKQKMGSQAVVLQNVIQQMVDKGCLSVLKSGGFATPEHIHFVGFTALSRQEEALIIQLKTVCKFHFWMDNLHPKIIGNPAAHFYNKNKTLFKDDFRSTNAVGDFPKIAQYACTGNVEQVQLLFDILKKLPKEELSKTVVYLPDASVLPLILYHQPEQPLEFNTGIGMPLLRFEPFKFVWFLLNLYGKRNRQVDIQRHPFFELISKNPVESELDFEGQKGSKALNNLLEEVAANAGGHKALAFLKSLWRFLLEILRTDDFAVNQVDTSCLLLLVGELEDTLTLLEKKTNIEDYINPVSLAKESIRSLELTVKGEKGRGVQILSTLEGRALDFDQVIYLSFNEDNFSFSTAGFIPSDLRRSYKLPSLDDKNAVMSYHLYRSITRAKNAHFIYNSHSEGTSSGEVARFLMQLDKLYLKSSIQTTSYSSLATTHVLKENVVEKSDAVMQKLKHYLQHKGMSPSALNTLLSNPLDFYLRYVVGLKEVEHQEKLHPSTIGSAVHNCLEKTYKKYILKEDLQQINKAIKNAGHDADAELRELLEVDINSQGEIQLLRSVLSAWLEKFYRFDLQRLSNKVKIISLEEDISHLLPVSLSGLSIPIKLHGFIDRVENELGVLRILDYKTGKVIESELKLKQKDLRCFDSKKSKALQLMIYTYIYRAIHPQNEFEAGIYSFRNAKAGIIPLKFDNSPKISEQVFGDFEQGLFTVLSGLLDPGQPFVHVEPEYENLLPF